jgi:uncharacterized RDD family membrane protein YckC
MHMAWYYARGEEAVGPLDAAAFEAALADGTITAETLVWREGMAQWQPYGEIAAPPGIPAGALPALEPCTVCGKAFPPDDLIHSGDARVCAECKPVYFGHLQETGARYGEMRLAGFGARAAAKLLDSLLMAVVLYGAAFAIGALLSDPAFLFRPDADYGDSIALTLAVAWNLSSFILPALYTVWFLGRYGATPGKMALGLRVVRPDGTPVTYLRALGRHFGEMITSITCGLGYFTALIDAQHRTLHDMICDTRVVMRAPRR